MILTPNAAKSIVDQFSGAKMVPSTKGQNKGQHVLKAFRFEYHGTSTRHISIIRKATQDGVTVYVNKRSSSNIVFPSGELRPVRVTRDYPKGFEGKTGDKGLSAAAADLPTLDPKDNDVLRLSVSSEESFRRLLDWYFDAAMDATKSNGHGLVKETGGEDGGPEPAVMPSANMSATVSIFTKTGEGITDVKIRYGQGGFREALFKIAGEKCWMTGIEGGRLLIASHIMPWSHCDGDTDSRGQSDNGLLLSALWDAAFDAGLISFDSDWKVVASPELSESAKLALRLDEHVVLPENGKFRTEGRKVYLAYHRKEVFEYWKKTESQEKEIL
jgi:hypothetical protein